MHYVEHQRGEQAVSFVWLARNSNRRLVVSPSKFAIEVKLRISRTVCSGLVIHFVDQEREVRHVDWHFGSDGILGVRKATGSVFRKCLKKRKQLVRQMSV